MTTYVLFLFGTFEDMDDVEYFCMEVLGASESIASLKYMIENSKNIIVIFDTTVELEKIQNELSSLLNNENVLFYFMFKKESIVLSHIPETMNNLIFKPTSQILKFQIGDMVEDNQEHNLDDILEKIEKTGVESLTPSEKKFLDNFEN